MESIVELAELAFVGVSIFYVAYMLIYSTFLFASACVGMVEMYGLRMKDELKNQLDHDYYMPVTIIVPAYNEEVTVVDTVLSLLQLDYKLYEIVVVDDGSKDDTAKMLIEHFDMHQIERPIRRQIHTKPIRQVYECYTQKVPVTLVRKENGGKADALNVGINTSRYPYFICMDADSALQRDSLQKIMMPLMENDNIVAVGGMVHISNGMDMEQGVIVDYRLPKSLLVCMQILEYGRSFMASRILMDKFNGNLIISGAFGLFQKSMVIAVGGYDANTMGEDMELVVKLHVFCRSHNIDYSIRYAPDAVCWSQAPESLRDLKKQRRRWHIGLMQTIKKYKQIFFRPSYGAVGMISYLYFLLYEYLSPLIEIFGVITILVGWELGMLNVPFMILFFLVYAAFGAVVSITTFFARMYSLGVKLRRMDMAKAVLLCLVENAGLRMVLAWVRLKAMFTGKKKQHDWGQIKRHKMGTH